MGAIQLLLLLDNGVACFRKADEEEQCFPLTEFLPLVGCCCCWCCCCCCCCLLLDNFSQKLFVLLILNRSPFSSAPLSSAPFTKPAPEAHLSSGDGTGEQVLISEGLFVGMMMISSSSVSSACTGSRARSPFG